MRFDMHPLASGWALSEVNADVPGGMNEAGPLCRLAVRYLGRRPPPDPQAAIAEACAARLGRGARIALVHATSYSDDRQQMEGLADALASVGLRGEPCAPDHVHEGRLRLAGREGPIAGIVRFFPAEWLPNLPSAAWTSWRDDWCTPACNHMAAALVQSKRLPLAWDALGLDLPAWRSVSPPCRTPRWRDDPAWVRKPAWGRVGGGVGIAEAISRDESRRIRWSARLHPRWWVEQERFASYLMLFFGRLDADKGWTKQIHLGARRGNNTRMLRLLGPDTGFDSIGDWPQADALATYLDRLDQDGALPKMVLYNLNPADNYVLATMAGNFQDGKIAGKIQFGSGWWFLDQKEAMEWQMNALSNTGLFSRFIGMLTDSRSFMSYPRHEYFRRVLCNLIGRDIENGEIPDADELVGPMIENICFGNARDFLGLELGGSAAGSR